MAVSRVIVVPAYRGRGMVGLTILVGLLAGLALYGLYQLVLLLSAQGLIHPAAMIVILFAPLLFVGSLFAAGLARITQNFWRVVGLGVVFWIAMAIGMDIPNKLEQAPSGGLGAVSLSEWAATCAWVFGLATVLGAVVSWCALWCIGTFRFTILEQDGELCWRCAYRTGSPRISACPECGTPIDASRFRCHWLHRSVALGRRAGWIGVVACASVVAVLMLVNLGPVGSTNRFATGMRRFGTVSPAFMVGPGSTLTNLQLHGCVGATIPLEPPLQLEVAFDPTQSFGPVMQLQIARVPTRSGNVSESTVSVPMILCDLNASQADAVIANGVPQALKDAMVAAAAGVSWTGWQGPGPAPPNVRIDPTPYFGSR